MEQCDGCRKRAIFKTIAVGRAFSKYWCEKCLKVKMGKYEMTVWRLDGGQKKK